MAEIVQTITGSHGDMTLCSNGVILFTSEEGLLIDPEVVRRTDAEFRQLAGGPYVSVLDFRPAAFASRPAGDLAAQDTEDAALASALVMNHEIGRWLASNWVADSEPQRPVGMFEDVESALAWASEQADGLLG